MLTMFHMQLYFRSHKEVLHENIRGKKGWSEWMLIKVRLQE